MLMELQLTLFQNKIGLDALTHGRYGVLTLANSAVLYSLITRGISNPELNAITVGSEPNVPVGKSIGATYKT